MKESCKVAGIGEILWDVLPQGKQLGGAPCNFAFHAQQSGLESYVISAIGQDTDGDELLKVLDHLGLNASFVQSKPDYQTGRVTVSLDQVGNPDYTIHENVAWDYIEPHLKLKAFAREVDAICFGSLAQRSRVSMATIWSFLESSRPDCLKVFDINLRQSFYNRETILKSLEFANVLKLNDDELPVLASFLGYEGDEESIIKQLLIAFELKLIAYTKGARGSILLTQDEISYGEVRKVEVADSVGAGDSFTAFLVAGILNNLELKKIHRAATDVAAYVCTQHGATPELPEELIETITNNI